MPDKKILRNRELIRNGFSVPSLLSMILIQYLKLVPNYFSIRHPGLSRLSDRLYQHELIQRVNVL